MSAPKVSVLMSVLNGETYLGEAIDSILAQSFTDFEFLIVDNASTDRTPEIIRSYEDARIVHIRNPETLNLAQSLNKGLAAATGQYIARLDADDVALPGRLLDQSGFLDNHGNVALVASAWTDFGHGYAFPGVLSPIPPQDHDSLIIELAGDNTLAHSTIMFRRDAALEIGGYPEDFAYCMDYVLYFRLSRKFRLAALTEPTVAMRNHDRQITVDPAWGYRRAEELARATSEFAALSTLTPAAARAVRRHQAKSCLRAAWHAARSARIGTALGWMTRAASAGPIALISAASQSAADRLASLFGRPRHLPGQGPQRS